MTNKYKNVIDRFIDEKLTIDDILLETKVEHFYKTKQIVHISEIIDFLREKKISELAADMANQLEGLMNAEADAAPAQAPQPLISEPPAASVNSRTLLQSVPPPMPAVCTPHPPQAQPQPTMVPMPQPCPQTNNAEVVEPVKGMSVPTAPRQAEPAAASIASSAEISYIDPAAHLPTHPVAELMPHMSAEDFEAFVENMKLGQREPVTMFNGQLIDGRHRALACQRLNMPIMVVNWDQVGTVEDFVIAKNVQRRQLTQAQRAAIAIAFLPKLREEALARMTSGKSNPAEALSQGKSADIAGGKLGVSGKSVAAAEKIKAESEELFQQVLNGELSIPKARKLAGRQSVTPAQAERKICSVEEAVSRILQLVPEHEFNTLLAIASYSPAVVSKAINNRIDGEFSGEPNRFQMILDALTPGLTLASGN